jgi:hypothetical protein
MSRWVNLDQNNYYDLQPDQSQVINFHIDVPKDAPSGGQYVVIFAETGKLDPSGGASVQVNKRIGYKFYANLGGETRQAGRIESVAQNQLYFEPPIISTSQVRNTGNVDFQATHKFKVVDLMGKEKYSETKEMDVLPDTCREVTLKWDGAPAFGLFNVTNEIEYLDQIHYNETKLVLVIPIYVIIIFGLVLILLIWAIILKIKKARRR